MSEYVFVTHTYIQYTITIIYTKIQINILNFHPNISQNKRWAFIKRRKMHILLFVKFATNFQMILLAL